MINRSLSWILVHDDTKVLKTGYARSIRGANCDIIIPVLNAYLKGLYNVKQSDILFFGIYDITLSRQELIYLYKIEYIEGEIVSNKIFDYLDILKPDNEEKI